MNNLYHKIFLIGVVTAIIVTLLNMYFRWSTISVVILGLWFIIGTLTVGIHSVSKERLVNITFFWTVIRFTDISTEMAYYKQWVAFSVYFGFVVLMYMYLLYTNPIVSEEPESEPLIPLV